MSADNEKGDIGINEDEMDEGMFEIVDFVESAVNQIWDNTTLITPDG